MRIALTTLPVSAAIMAALLIGSNDVCRAQSQSEFNTESASLVALSSIPTNSFFWSMSGQFPPSPFFPFPNLFSLYTDGTPGNYWYNDAGFDYSAYFSQVSAEANLSRSRASTMDDVPPPPGGFGGSGGSSGGGAIPEGEFLPPSGYTNCKTWTNFWLEISNSSDVISITISNTLPGLSYILLETTNLTNPDWVPIQTNAASGTSVAASPISAGTNKSLFFRAMLTANDQPPLITVPPSNQVVALGQTAVFTVTATGFAPLSYQWQFNGTNLPGKTASTLTIGNVQTNNVGSYMVIVSNVICWESATAGLGLAWYILWAQASTLLRRLDLMEPFTSSTRRISFLPSTRFLES